MSKSVETLQAILNNCDCKLDCIISQLEQCTDVSSAQLNTQLNPIKMVHDMKDIKQRLTLAKEKYLQLECQKKEMVEEIEQEIVSLSQEISSIVN